MTVLAQMKIPRIMSMVLATLAIVLLLVTVTAMAEDDTIQVDSAVLDDDDDHRLDDIGFHAMERGDGREGVDIEVYDSFDQLVYSGTTDRDGELYFYDLENGRYTWKAFHEREEIDGGSFDIAVGVREVQGTIMFIGWEDNDLNDVVLWAYNHYGTGEANTTGRLKDSGGNIVAEATTDYDGVIPFSELPRGWYDFEVIHNLDVISTGRVYSFGPDPKADSAIEGTVTNMDTGAGIPFAWIWLFEENGKYFYMTSTDGNGEYSVAVRSGSYRIYIEHREYAEERSDVRAPRGDTAIYDAELDHNALLYGYVRDALSSQPIPAASVELWDDRNREYGYTESKPNGYYEIWVPAGVYEVLAYHGDYEDYESTATLREDDRQQHDISMVAKPAKDARVHGYVTDSETDDPIRRVEVELYDSENGEYFYDHTDRDGYYSIPCYGGRTYDFYTYHVDYYNYEDTVTVGIGQEVRKDVELDIKPLLYGHITDKETGEPVANAEVDVYDRSRNGDGGRGYYRTSTDRDGYYELRIEEGTYTFDVYHDDYEKYRDTFSILDGDELKHNAELTPKGAEDSRVHGTVTNSATGDTVGGADVFMYNDDDSFSTQTTRSGTYEIDCRAGTYTIEVRHPDYHPHSGEVTVRKEEDVQYDVELEPKGAEDSRVYGTVTDKGTGNPIEGATVHLYNKNDDYWARTDRDGSYGINCRAGEYTIEVSHEGYETHSGKVTVRERDQVQYDVELEPKGAEDSRVHGTVTNSETGDTVGNADVYMYNEDDSYSTQTSRSGTYEIDCRAGTYTIEVRHPDYHPHSGEVTVREGGDVQYDVELDPKGPDESRVHGTVTDSGTGDPVEGAKVVMSKGGDEYSARTDRKGEYEITCPAGEYTIEVSHDGYETHSGTVTVREGEDTQYDVPLDPGEEPLGRMHGKVTDARTGDALKDVLVTMTHRGTLEEHTGTTDGRGAYSIEVPEGTYDVEVSLFGYVTRTDTVTIGAGQERERNYPLDPEERRLSGRVTDTATGRALEGVTVTVEEHDGGGRSGGYSNSTTTDSDGTYEMYVPPGDYTMTIELPDHVTITEDFTIGVGEDREKDYTMEHVPQKTMTITALSPPDEMESGESEGLFYEVRRSDTGGALAGVTISLVITGPATTTSLTATTDRWGKTSFELTAGNVGSPTTVTVNASGNLEGYETGYHELTVLILPAPAMDSYGVEITGPASQTVNPGGRLEYTLTIRNTGSTEDTFGLTLLGMYRQWGVLGGTEVTITAGGEHTITVAVNVPVLIPAGTYTLEVKATSRGDPASPKASDETTLTVIVESAGGDPDGEDDDALIPGFELWMATTGLLTGLLLWKRRT